MTEYLQEAYEELKRAEHLIFVSLKYTRTVDVIKSVIQRLISTYDAIFMGLLETAVEEGKLEAIPRSPGEKVNLLKEQFAANEEMLAYLDRYLLYRKIVRASFTRAREFRRHVTMTATVDGKELEIDIEVVTEYFEHTKEFFRFIRNLLKEDDEEEA